MQIIVLFSPEKFTGWSLGVGVRRNLLRKQHNWRYCVVLAGVLGLELAVIITAYKPKTLLFRHAWRHWSWSCRRTRLAGMQQHLPC